MNDTSYKILTIAPNALTQEQKNLIVARWARSLKYGNDFFRLIDGPGYWNAYPGFILSLLNRLGCEVRLAVLADDPDVILGFMVSTFEVVHFVHSQKDVRRQGIATALLGNRPWSTITHLTKSGISLWTTRLPKAKFNPFFT